MERFERYPAGVLPDEIKAYKALYKGRRYWVFQNSKEHPFDDWTEDFAVVMYDRAEHVVMAYANLKADGSMFGSVLWGQGVQFEAADARAMVREVLEIDKWYR
jgi:hypothetical protein